MKLQIKQLSECSENLETVGNWIYEQWWRTLDNTPEVVLSLLREHTKKDSFPYTIVALDDGKPIGSCCVIENDCSHRPQYTPWVAAVFVKEEYRNNDVASYILKEALKVAKEQNIDGLYIDCLLKTARVYEKNGWTILEREVGDKDSVVLYQSTKKEQ